MYKVMKPIPFGRLIGWSLSEYARSGSLYGIDDPYRYKTGRSLEIFGEKLELPFGPAAGPHTQVAQNIIAGYAAGARFFELKTVQALDGEDLPVSKPCIAAPDECYNVEWSTELYVPQALDEYIKGWFALKLLSRELELGDSDGFVFNMSVGYDLDGIKSKKIDDFIEGLRYAGDTGAWQTCKQWAAENISRFERVDQAYVDAISPEICRSITLSTLHGCPPDEIERIASYLLTEKKLNTFVKCNPTLLGYEYARDTLDSLGFEYIAFDDHHFKADLQFSDAVPMLRRLQNVADSLSLTFGVKLTNTFPVRITGGELPGEEMYMSGRALFPLTIEVVNRLAEAFGGKLRVSFSGGADARNIDKLFDAGIWPITLATTLLKPGGYQRMRQIADILAGGEYGPFRGVDRDKLGKLTGGIAGDPMYRKPAGMPRERKMSARVPLLDCFAAPCRDGCPISQDVPAYLRLAGEGKHLEALRVITARNPLPNITGAICSQFCADKCTRSYYEGPVCIRDVKLEAADEAFAALLEEVKAAPGTPESGGKVAVIGGGPAGLSVAYFLARAGRPVTVFEKRSSPGGIVSHIIPAFRIADDAVMSDVALVKAMGAEIKLNTEFVVSNFIPHRTGQECSAGQRDADVITLNDLCSEGFETIVLASGAWEPAALDTLSHDENGAALDALDFLERLKHDPASVRIGRNVVVIGGGNTAMDTARAAKRAGGVKNVSLVYRRTKRYMPADPEELELALGDGVVFRELLAPIGLRDGVLTCGQMELGAPDASGRRSPVATGGMVDIPADTVIYAIGNPVDPEIFAGLGIPADKKGRAIVNSDTLESSIPGVYVIGDSRRGPSTVVQAIEDAMRCADAIISAGTASAACDIAGAGAVPAAGQERYAGLNVNPDPVPARRKRGILCCDSAEIREPDRCLECATLCRCCVDVCPNRANISVMVDGRMQIAHIDDMCNECGNCEMFCPYSSAPYKDKFTMYANTGDFENGENPGFTPLEGGAVRVRIDGKTAEYSDGHRLPEGIWPLIVTVLRVANPGRYFPISEGIPVLSRN